MSIEEIIAEVEQSAAELYSQCSPTVQAKEEDANSEKDEDDYDVPVRLDSLALELNDASIDEYASDSANSAEDEVVEEDLSATDSHHSFMEETTPSKNSDAGEIIIDFVSIDSHPTPSLIGIGVHISDAQYLHCEPSSITEMYLTNIMCIGMGKPAQAGLGFFAVEHTRIADSKGRWQLGH